MTNSSAVVAACLALPALVCAGAGCGSGGSATPMDISPGSPPLSWQDDGAAHAATFGSASLVTSSGIQTLQIAGGEAGGIGIAFGVSAKLAVGLGTFQCGSAAGSTGYPITSFSYTADGVDPLFQSCMVSVTALGTTDGEHATGSFSAVLTKTAGGTKAITSGVFNLPLNVSP